MKLVAYIQPCRKGYMLGPFFFLHPFFSGDFWSYQVDTFHTPNGLLFFGGGPNKILPQTGPTMQQKMGFSWGEIWVQMCSSTLNADNGGRKKSKRRVTEVFQTYCLCSFRRKKNPSKGDRMFILDILAYVIWCHVYSCWASLLIILGFGVSLMNLHILPMRMYQSDNLQQRKISVLGDLGIQEA